MKPVTFTELSSPVWSSAQDIIGGEERLNDYQQSQGVRFQCSRIEGAEEDDIRFGNLIFSKGSCGARQVFYFSLLLCVLQSMNGIMVLDYPPTYPTSLFKHVALK
jgi:hypothetical protein